MRILTLMVVPLEAVPCAQFHFRLLHLILAVGEKFTWSLDHPMDLTYGTKLSLVGDLQPDACVRETLYPKAMGFSRQMPAY